MRSVRGAHCLEATHVIVDIGYALDSARISYRHWGSIGRDPEPIFVVPTNGRWVPPCRDRSIPVQSALGLMVSFAPRWKLLQLGAGRRGESDCPGITPWRAGSGRATVALAYRILLQMLPSQPAWRPARILWWWGSPVIHQSLQRPFRLSVHKSNSRICNARRILETCSFAICHRPFVHIFYI